VGSHTLDPTPCEGVLYTCCGVVVNLSFFKKKTPLVKTTRTVKRSRRLSAD